MNCESLYFLWFRSTDTSAGPGVASDTHFRVEYSPDNLYISQEILVLLLIMLLPFLFICLSSHSNCDLSVPSKETLSFQIIFLFLQFTCPPLESILFSC